MPPSSGPVRKAAVAGTWYPGRAEGIEAEVDGYLGEARPEAPPGRLVALVSPHAGLKYSGPVAAHGYSLLRGLSDLTVILVGPSHHVSFDGIGLYPRGAFETPLGVVPVDEGLAAALIAAEGMIRDLPGPHTDEHSLEMQLPFLQRLVSELRILPALMGTQSREEVDSLAAALVRVLGGRRVLIVASSDLSHYHSAPVANRLDALVVGDVERFDAEALMARIERDHGHACGGGPMVAVMKAARGLGANRAAVLKYGDSGDVGERDKGRVVGYLSAAFTSS
jgi:AmmeMemoRadiSam system protein B